MKLAVTALIIGFAPSPASADFSYQETTRVTGGAMAGMMNMAGAFSKDARKATEPKQTTIAVKGNRMARKSADTLSVTDLDQETITNVNYAKKTYSVMTFAQMKQAMDQMSQRMSKQTAAAPAPDTSNMQFDVKVKDTGNTKSVGGNMTHEVVMTLTMQGTDAQSGAKGGLTITSDMWLVPDVSGYGEMREFYRRMSQKMAWTPDAGGMMMSRPGMVQGMSRLTEEMAKMKGVAVLKVTRIDGAMDGMAQGDASAAQQQQQSQSSAPPTSVGGALGGMLASRMAKRRQDAAQTSSSSGAGSLMETTEETGGFSSSVDSSIFEIPSDFKKVEDPMSRAAGRGAH